MTGILRSGRMLAAFLSLALTLGTFGGLSVSAQGRYNGRYYRRQHHSRAKGVLIGGGAGLVGGALLGGRKGAVIGAGTGAGAGYLIQRNRNRRHRRHYYRRY